MYPNDVLAAFTVSLLAGTGLDPALAGLIAADRSLPVPTGAEAVTAALRDGWDAAASGGQQ